MAMMVEEKFEARMGQICVPVTILVSPDGADGAWISIQVGEDRVMLQATVEPATVGSRVEITRMPV